MAEIMVEIHVPLTPAPGGPQFRWIDTIEDFLIELEDEGAAESYDDGEEFGDHYVFFINGGTEQALLAAASRVATLDGVPAGAFAVVTDDEADEMGAGRRVSLPVT
ncbi:hypothetical protein ACQP2E_17815 [Actinoplanes sp. CA-015351]|uniref:hypothetical protein n=1 Tax=Actinoplanes sp. CA-015351 TaxID=3239897 RepID=UPI003D95C6AB